MGYCRVGQWCSGKAWLIYLLLMRLTVGQYGEKLSQALGQEGLPFSGLLFDPQSGPSNFGRPPTNPSPSSDPDSYLPSATPSAHYVPTPHDPFFLPPPFIPSNQHLKDLCDQAENYLKEAHGRLEDEVRHFISLKTLELRDLEIGRAHV